MIIKISDKLIGKGQPIFFIEEAGLYRSDYLTLYKKKIFQRYSKRFFDDTKSSVFVF